MPIISGINQPFNSDEGVKRPTKLQSGAAPPPPGNDTEAESSLIVCPTSTVLGTFGPYLEFFASTSFAAVAWTLNIQNINSVQTKQGEIRFATGAIGFEVVFKTITYLSAFPGAADNCEGSPYSEFVNIPAGSRISAGFRQVDSGTVDGVCIGMTLFSAP